MRVLITTDAVGGVWQFTQELTEGLLTRKWAVALVSLGGELSSSQREWVNDLRARTGESFYFESCSGPLEWMQENDGAYWDIAPVLLDVCEGFGPDLLHLNQFCFGMLPVDVPKIITAHSDVLSWADATRAQPLEPSPWLTRYCELVRNGLQAADAVAAPTRWMLGALGANFALPEMAAVIENGRSRPAIMDQAKGKYAITAGRIWDEAKDVRMLQDVRTSFVLRVAGDCGQAESATVCGPAVEYLGKLSEAELFREFGRSAIYICTSRYEPFGLAPLEAGMCGCAVVARDIPSLREVWGDGAMYFANAESLTQLLMKLEDADLLAQAQVRSAIRARHFTQERMVEKYLALYAEVLTRTGAQEHVA